MTSMVPDSLMRDIATGAVDLDSDTFYAMLLIGYTPNKAHSTRADVQAFEVSGTGYTAGGQACAIVVTLDAVTHRLSVAVGDVTWAGASGWSARHLAIYKRRGGAANLDNLMAVGDFLVDKVAGGGAFVVNNPNPILLSNPN